MKHQFRKTRFSRLLVNWLVIPTLLLCTSCKPEDIEPKPYTIFIILAPIGNSQQIDLADRFLTYAEDYLLFPGFSYEIKGICQSGLEAIASPQYHQSASKDAIITQDTKDWLAKSFDNNQKSINSKCTEKIDSLSNVINTLNDYIEQNPKQEIFVFGQIPWDEISDRSYNQLKNEVKKIGQKKKIKKLYLFGRSTTAGAKVVDVFQEFGSTVVKPEGTGTQGVENMVSNAKKEIEVFIK